MLVRVDKTKVKRIIKKSGEWSGYMVGAKVSLLHIRRGWCIGCPVSFTSLENMEESISEWAYYNACWELGYYPAFYLDKAV